MQNERKLEGLETHLELVQDDPLEMASEAEVFEGDYFDCAESNDYLKLLKDWRESVNKFGMSDLSNHLYPLKYSIDLYGNNDPRTYNCVQGFIRHIQRILQTWTFRSIIVRGLTR